MWKTIKLVLLLFVSNSWATTYYVNATTGLDTNNGTSIATALKTIQKGADYANAGDTVLVMDGIYTNLPTNGEVVFLNKSGNATNWIIFKNYPNHHPKIKFNTWAAFSIQPGTAFVEINGFEIQGNNDNVTLANALNQFHSCNNPGTDADPYQAEFNGNGIAADGRYSSPGFAKPHHIRILNNIVYDCGGGGISAIQSDYITIKNNLVYDNSWYTIFGSSGISIYQSWSSDNNTTDFKNIIDGNICHHNRLFVPWFSGCVISDGNGIIIDDSKNTQNGSILGVYNGKTLVQNNIVYFNGGSGIHSYESKHITIVNNTAYKNSESTELTDGQIFANSSDDVKIINNILYAGSDGKINSNYNNTNLVYENNIHFNGTPIILTSPSCIVGNPNFVNESSFNFHLQNNSPAINTGNTTMFASLDFDGNTRTNPDIGAFEYNNALGINDFDLQSSKIKIYPNPTSGNLSLETSEIIDKIVLVNMTGQKIELKCKDNKLDLSKFSAGIYKIVFYKTNEIIEVQSVIKN
jgi:parallel beta-helix repeat protein